MLGNEMMPVMRKRSRIAVCAAAALRADGIFDVSYSGMPMENDDFSANDAKVKMGFIGQIWEKPVKFRFTKRGTGASSAICESDGDVNAGDPNRYVYWLQVARKHGFGPKCQMKYYALPSLVGVADDKWGAYIFRYRGSQIEERIHIFGVCERDIMSFVRIVNHENGHRKSMQKPNEQGGWGDDLIYIEGLDKDHDGICDSFETNATGKDFSVDSVSFNAVKRDQKAWEALDHDPQTGICIEYENAVEPHRGEIMEDDFSWRMYNE